MTPTPGAMADAEYSALLDTASSEEKLAGIFLVRSLMVDGDDAVASRRMAEEHAARSAEAKRAMKVWRLAHGYES
jgi:hypothetical protein